MDIKFRDLFKKLVAAISSGSDNGIYLEKAIDEIVIYINKVMGKSFKIKHVTEDEILKNGETAFMYALGDTFCYSSRMIRTIQTKLKTTTIRKDYNPMYNDAKYAMYLLRAIAHELCHCNQIIEFKTGMLSEQSYLNSLCMAFTCYSDKVSYFDRPFEGEAYGNGVAIMKYLCNEDMLRSLGYFNLYKEQLSRITFFSKNLMMNEVIYYLDKIPFMKTRRGFEDIIKYINHNLTLLSKDKIKLLIRDYPLISVGLEEYKDKCRIKNPYELMEQYFSNTLKYGNKVWSLNNLETKALEDIYIYLLMPQLNEKVYSDLCIKYGVDKMESFMYTLRNLINKKINLYKGTYNESLDRVRKIRVSDKKILQDIDLEYVENKYKTSLIYLEDYKRRIDEFIAKGRIKK